MFKMSTTSLPSLQVRNRKRKTQKKEINIMTKRRGGGGGIVNRLALSKQVQVIRKTSCGFQMTSG